MLNKTIGLSLVLAASSAFAQSDGDLKEAQRHYKVALEALNDHNLGIASQELNRASALAPSNALVRYYLALVQSQQNTPGPALENLTRAMSLGLPQKESDLAEDLLAKLQYQSERAEADGRKPTPEKLKGIYTAKTDYSGTEGLFDFRGSEDWKRAGGSAYEREYWDGWNRTLSLNIVDQSRITGFIKLDIIHLTGRRSSISAEARESKVEEASYFLVDLLIDSGGTIEGTQREVCYQKPSPYGGAKCELTSSTTDSLRVSWDRRDGTLTFRWGSRKIVYAKTGSVPGSVGADVAYDASELRPFR